MDGGEGSVRKRPTSYNDWVQVITNNDPGVAANLIVDELKRYQDKDS